MLSRSSRSRGAYLRSDDASSSLLSSQHPRVFAAPGQVRRHWVVSGDSERQTGESFGKGLITAVALAVEIDLDSADVTQHR